MILQSDVEVEAVRPIRETDSNEGAPAVVVHYLDHKIPEEGGGIANKEKLFAKAHLELSVTASTAGPGYWSMGQAAKSSLLPLSSSFSCT